MIDHIKRTRKGKLSKLTDWKAPITPNLGFDIDDGIIPKKKFYSFFRINENGKIEEQIYAYRKNKDDKTPLWELAVLREEGCKKDLVESRLRLAMGGYYFDFENKPRWYDYSPAPMEIASYACNRIGIYAYPITGLYEIFALLPEFKYIDIQKFLEVFEDDEMTGIEIVRQFPRQCEMAIKMGVPSIMRNKTLLKLHPAKFKEAMRYSKESGIPMDQYTVIAFNIKHKINPKKAIDMNEMITTGKTAKELGCSWEEALEIERYLIKQKHQKTEYSSYIRMRKELGMDTESHSAKFPHDLAVAYAEVSELHDEKKNKEINVKASAFFSEIIGFVSEVESVNSNEFHVEIPKTTKDFNIIGESLNNCVYRMGYIKKVIEKKDFILAIKNEKGYVACLEITPNKNNNPKIEQLYGNNNSSVDEKVRKFVNMKVLTKFKDYWNVAH